ncbi:hypothetical protein ACJQWK_02363 [Exserohilum turcicum]
MSSASDYVDDGPSDDSSAHSRRQSPRRRPSVQSIDPLCVRKDYLESKYSDAYRVLFNHEVHRAAARFETETTGHQYYRWHVGASTWSPQEQATLFAALERLGREDVPGIAAAIGTKSVPEIRELLVLLHDAAAKQGDAKVTLRDVPAATELSSECIEQLDAAGEALAWLQEVFEASQEKEKFGDLWLITPAVANEIESAIDPSRIREPTTPIMSEPEARARGGRVVAGACLSCKKFKQKCDRETPCGNCQRRKTECVYSHQSPRAERPETPKDESTMAGILQAIPEANLLQPQVMLTLSKTLFMNRSPTIPSPWPHWSEYTSELAQEPSIYRSAFGDFHNLVISLTKRLMQTAIFQATSRLRSQRYRVKKNAIPLVKRRDVLAAIDILGMQRNSQERWKGVARRCALRVYDGQWSRHRHKRTRREVPWDEVERIMTSVEQPADTLTTDAETSENDHVEFRSRASRKGTPLPMDRLALSDSDDESLIYESKPVSQSAPKSRDSIGRYTSVPPTISGTDCGSKSLSLEQFDQEASRQEEHSLWGMLDLEPPAKDDECKSDEDSDAGSLGDENIVTHVDGWRSWTDYRADWEEYEVPPNTADFIANQKPLAAPPALQEGTTDGVDSVLGDDIGLSRKEKVQQRQTKPAAIELQAWGTQAYAKLQGQTQENADYMNENSSQNDDSSDNAAHHRPIQSIENSTMVSSPAPRSSDDSDGDDVSMEKPAKSIERDGRIFPLSPSDDEDHTMTQGWPMPRIQARSKPPPTVYSDDEVGEMDWNSFID